MQTLDEALQKLSDNIELKSGFQYRDSTMDDKRSRVYNGIDKNADTCNVRLDWQVAEGLPDEEGAEDALKQLMVAQAKFDIEDLLENGDRQAYVHDAILKALDGTRKRDKELVNVEFLGYSLYRQHLKKSKRYEYTLYLALYAQWA